MSTFKKGDIVMAIAFKKLKQDVDNYMREDNINRNKLYIIDSVYKGSFEYHSAYSEPNITLENKAFYHLSSNFVKIGEL
jgi:hypothetical protein